MATSYTSLLGLALPVTGELAGTWGDTVNNAITALLDTAVAGTTTLSTDADVTLTTTTGASNQARQAILLCSGARTALRTVTAPAQSKIYVVINNTTGGFGVKLVGVGPTTGVTVAAGKTAVLVWNGSDFVEVAPATATTATNLAGGAAGSVPYQTAASTTTMLAIGANNYVLTSTGTAPTWTANTGTGNVVRATSPTITTPAITGGTIDNTVIGGTTRAAGNFTTLDANGNVILGDTTTDTVTVNGYMGVGGAGNAQEGLRIANSALTGVNQYGLNIRPTSTSAATGNTVGVYVNTRTAAETYTASSVRNIWVENVTKGAGSTITDQHGLYVSDQTQGTNNYGITSLVSSGANKWNIYASGTADNYFAGDVGIGVTSPNEKFAVRQDSTDAISILSALTTTSAAGAPLVFKNIFSNGGSGLGVARIGWGTGANVAAGYLSFETASASNAPVERMRIDSAGNVGIGTTTPTSTLSVTGSANVTGNVILGDATTDTVTVNGYMGIGGAGVAGYAVHIASTSLTGSSQYGMVVAPVMTSSSTSNAVGIAVLPSTAAAAVTYAATTGIRIDDFAKGAGSTVTNQHGLRILDQTQGTNNYGITSLVSSGSNKWNIYASGTAANYFAGNVGIAGSPVASLTVGNLPVTETGSTSYGSALLRGANYTLSNTQRGILDVEMSSVGAQDAGATISFTNNVNQFGQGLSYVGAALKAGKANATNTNQSTYLAFYTNSSGTLAERLRIDSAGNVGIGTSSPQARLHVAVDGQGALFTRDGVASLTLRTTFAGTDGSFLIAQKSRGTGASPSIVSSGDRTWDIRGSGYDGAAYQAAGRITIDVDGAPGINSMPGRLVFYTTPNLGASPFERMRIDSAGNVGIGITPNAWGSAFRAIEGNSFSLAGTTSSPGTLYLANNSYINSSSQYIYKNSAAASIYYQTAGQHNWWTAASGTAGNVISFTQALMLDASGNLGVGTTPSAWITGTTSAIQLRRGSVSSSSGGPADHIAISANAYNTGSNDPGLTTWTYSSAGRAELYEQRGGSHIWYNSPVGVAGDPITFTQAMVLGASGILSVAGNAVLGDASTDTVTVNGYMGVGGAGAANKGLYQRNTALTGATQYGLTAEGTFSSAAITGGVGLASSFATEAAAFTMVDAIGFRAFNVTKGAGSTITNQYGVYVDDQTTGTNNFGITSLVSSGTNKWNIYASGTAANYFAGNVLVGTSTAYAWSNNFNPVIRLGAGAYVSGRAPSANYDEIYVGTNAYNDGVWKYGVDGFALQYYQDSGQHVFRNAASGTANAAITFNERFAINQGEAVFNDPGNDYDFRVESDTNTHAFFVQGSDGNVGIGTSSPGSLLDVAGGVQATGAVMRLTNSASSSSWVAGDVVGAVDFYSTDASFPGTKAQIKAFADTGNGTIAINYSALSFSTMFNGAFAERLRIDSSGNVGIGTASPLNKVDINGSLGRNAPVTKTTSFTLAATENWLICNGTGTITVTLPAASSWTGREVMIKTIAAFTVVSASSNVVPLAGGAAGTAILAATAGAWATLVSDGTNWIIMQA